MMCSRSLPDTCRFKVQHHERVLSVAFSSDGTHFATGSDDGVRVFESATGTQTLKLACADFAVHDVVFSPDALSVAVAGGWTCCGVQCGDGSTAVRPARPGEQKHADA